MMYIENMIRTQIYLTPKQHALLRKKASEAHTTLSDEVRGILDKDLFTETKPEQRQKSRNWLHAIAQDAKQAKVQGPADLASKVDAYLYGGKK